MHSYLSCFGMLFAVKTETGAVVATDIREALSRVTSLRSHSHRAPSSSLRTRANSSSSSSASARTSLHRVSHKTRRVAAPATAIVAVVVAATSSIGSNHSASPQTVLVPGDLPCSTLDSVPVGGRLRHFWPVWQKLGASRKVVRWLRFGYPLPFFKNARGLPLTPPLLSVPNPSVVTAYSDPAKQALLDETIQTLLAKQAIREVPHSDPVHFSRVFLVPKKNGKLRMVIDLSQLNAWIDCPSFKMDHAQVVRDALAPDMWATSIDLSDAYLHIPVNQQYWKYLTFQVGSRRFQFMCLPFGLNTAPRLFSEVMKVLKRWGRLMGILLFQYLDDWLQLNLNASVLQKQTVQLMHQCLLLGLLVNHEKSEPIPLQRIVFLGDLLDFEQGFIFPTAERFQSIQDRILSISKRPTTSLHSVHSLVGVLTATEKIVPFGRIHFRSLQCFLNDHLTRKTPKYHQVELPLAAWKDLQWWSDKDKVFRGLAMSRQIPDLQIQTDASTSGWGINLNGSLLSGTWSSQETQLHINLLEMKAVLLACQKLTMHMKHKTVLFLIDNQTVVSYLRKQGGTRSRQLMTLTKEVFEIAERHCFIILAQHIKGALNVVADLASRIDCVVSTEWALSDRLFTWIQNQSPWEPAVIDLFANSLNHRLPLYVSPCPDPAAMAVNALVVPWPRTRTLYAFPPTTIVDRVLQKVLKERPAQLLLVLPDLIEASWYPLLQQLPRTKSVRLPVQVGDLRQPHWNHTHQNPAMFKLYLWCVNFPP